MFTFDFLPLQPQPMRMLFLLAIMIIFTSCSGLVHHQYQRAHRSLKHAKHAQAYQMFLGYNYWACMSEHGCKQLCADEALGLVKKFQVSLNEFNPKVTPRQHRYYTTLFERLSDLDYREQVDNTIVTYKRMYAAAREAGAFNNQCKNYVREQ